MNDEGRSREELIAELNRLRERNANMAHILDAITDGCFILDDACRVTFLNDNALQEFAKYNEDIIGKNIWDILPETIKRKYYSRYKDAVTAHHPIQFTEYYPLSDQWLTINATPTQRGLIVYFQDITRQKQLEKKLSNSNKKINTILESISDAFFTLDNNWCFTYINKAAEEFLMKRDKDELMGLNIWEAYPGLVNTSYYFKYQEAYRTQKPVYFEAASAYSKSWYSVSVYPGEQGLSVYYQNITEIKKAREDLNQAEKRFAIAFNSSPCAMLMAKLENCEIVAINNSYERITGYSKKEALGKNLLELEICSDPNICCKMVKSLKEVGDYKKYESKIRTKSGQIITCLVSLQVTNIKREQYLIAAFDDITERKEMEEALQASEERFYKMFHLSPDIMVLSAIETGICINVNQSFLNCFGYSREEVIGKSTQDLVYEPGGREKLIDQLKQEEILQNEEISVHGKSGEKKILLLSADTIELRGTKYLLSSSKDITKHKNLERELARLERLHLIGQMSASIGHEIRNPMTTIRGFLQMMEKRELNVANREYYALMIQELDRANTILTEFLSLTKDKLMEYREHNINSILKALYPLMWGDAIKQDKDIVMEAGEIPDLAVNESEIRQLILNLVRNGLEASEAGNRLLIKTFVENQAVVLSVQDEGTGICDEILEKLGTPFITTKSQGTGLGLAVCYSIADRHNATIDVNTGSRGTTFNVRFRISQTA